MFGRERVFGKRMDKRGLGNPACVWEEDGVTGFCFPSCPWCPRRVSLGMAEMRGVLLVQLGLLHSSTSECAAFLPLTLAAHVA